MVSWASACTPRSRRPSTTSSGSSSDAIDRVRLRAQRPAVPVPRSARLRPPRRAGRGADVRRLAGPRGPRGGPAGRAGLDPVRGRARGGAQRRAAPSQVPCRPRARRRRRRRSAAPGHPGHDRHPGGARWRVSTPRGDVDAGDVLVATNAYADSLVPSLRRRVLPMGSFIIATEPLAPDLADAVLPTRRMCFNDRNLLWYWRLDDAGRMVFGGRKRLGQVTPGGGARSPLPVDGRGPPAARRHAGGAGLGRPGRPDPRPAPPLRPDRRALVRDGLQRLRRGAQHLARSSHGGRHRRRATPSLRRAAGTARSRFHSMRRAWLPVVSAWFRFQDRRAA